MTMTEIPIAPSEHPVIRRWFEGEHLDLIVWENLSGELLRFRLLSRLIGSEIEGFYWCRKDGLRHGHLPENHNENDWNNLHWVCESRPAGKEFLRAWKMEGPTLPPIIYSFIQSLMVAHGVIVDSNLIDAH